MHTITERSKIVWTNLG